MTAFKTILWVQLLLALAVGYAAFAYVHWGAMSIAWTNEYKAGLEKARRAPDFREPPPIRGESFDRVVENMKSGARARANVAFYWLLTCGAAVVLTASQLWLIRRLEQKVFAPKPN